VTGGTVAVMAIILLLAFKEGAAERFANVLMTIIGIVIKKPKWLKREREALQKTLISFRSSLVTCQKNPRLLIKPFFFAIIAWIFSLLIYLMVLYALGYTELVFLVLLPYLA
jgi:small-conductance mechanosensitive channel